MEEWIGLPEVTQEPVEGDEGIDWDWEGVMDSSNTSYIGKRRRRRSSFLNEQENEEY